MQAQASHKEGPCTHIERVPVLIECVWDRFNLDDPQHAKSVAWCESRYNPHAVNGDYKGLYQHDVDYWDKRFHDKIKTHTLRNSWDLSPSIWNARTQAIVTALMVRTGSWSPWSCG